MGGGTTTRVRGAVALVGALVLWATAGATPIEAAPPVPAPVTSASTTTLTFGFTGAPATWTVPDGITQATFAVYGAQGSKQAFPGGLGGMALATLEVTPGQQVVIVVGGQGQLFSGITCVLAELGDDDRGAGGYNGGGDGGLGCASGGGGGASDVRIGGADLDDRVIVAGGGGAGAGNLICNGAGGGGGLTGGSATANALCSGGGVGGNQNGTTGSGVSGVGGVGGDQGFLSGPGGGGGGGFWGGSGGASSLGGGGGSGTGPLGTTFATGVRAGDGLVTVSFGDAPQVTDLLPSSGSVGTSVQILGHNFDPTPGGTTVTFGGVPATVTSCTTTDCTVTVPPGSDTVDVVVTANSEQSLENPDAEFEYLPTPSITSIDPPSAAPGTTVTVHGDGFVVDAGYTGMQFGNNGVPASCTTRFLCTTVVPGMAIGPTLLRAVTPAGGSQPAAFTVLPEVTAISPTEGPEAGGTVVTITGTGFDPTAGATAVSFGGVTATAVGCQSTTTCTAVSPAGTGTVDVIVTVGGVASAAAAADRFTYRSDVDEEPTTTTTTTTTAPPSTTTTTAPTTTTSVVSPPSTAAAVVVASPRFTG